LAGCRISGRRLGGCTVARTWSASPPGATHARWAWTRRPSPAARPAQKDWHDHRQHAGRSEPEREPSMAGNTVTTESSDSGPRCAALRKDGTPCTVQVLGDASYCWAHDPALAEQRAAKRRLGGQNRANAKRLAKLLPPRLLPVWEQLEAALGDVLT